MPPCASGKSQTPAYVFGELFDSAQKSNKKQDDEVKTAKGETRARVHAPSARESKKALKTNGHGLARSVGSATPSAAVHSEDLTASGKKKRKARKKFLVRRHSKSDFPAADKPSPRKLWHQKRAKMSEQLHLCLLRPRHRHRRFKSMGDANLRIESRRRSLSYVSASTIVLHRTNTQPV
jgi:hypothetical protein